MCVSVSLNQALSYSSLSLLLARSLKEKKSEKDKMAEGAVRRINVFKIFAIFMEKLLVAVSFLIKMEAFSLPPLENIRKPLDFLMFSGGMKKACDLPVFIFLLFEDFLT